MAGYEEIYKRWTISDSSGVDPLLIRRIWLITLSIVLLAAGFALFNFAMNQILKRRVAEKTQELQLRMHQLQRESKIRYAMIEYASGGMVSFDRRFRIQLMNNAAIRMSGSHLDQTGSDVRKLPIFGEIIAQMDPPLLKVTRMMKSISRPQFIWGQSATGVGIGTTATAPKMSLEKAAS